VSSILNELKTESLLNIFQHAIRFLAIVPTIFFFLVGP